MDGSLSNINKLKPSSFNIREASKKAYGFIAHELEEVYPSMVTGEKDAVDGDGKILLQGVAYSKLIPFMVKAIQELTAKVEALENNNQQGDSGNEQEQQSAGSGDSGGDASSESSGEDSGGVEGSGSESSNASSGESASSESASDESDESSGSSGSDASADSEGGSGEDDSGGRETSEELSSEWTKD